MTAARALALASALALAGCGPREGDKCSGQGHFCADDHTAMECQHGRLREIPCEGAGGCGRFGDDVCSQRYDLVRVGDGCFLSDEGLGRCYETKTLFFCHDGSWTTKGCCPCYSGGGGNYCGVCNPV